MTVGDLIKEFVESKKHLINSVKDYESVFGTSYYSLHKYYDNQRLPGYQFIYGLKKAGMDISVFFRREVYIETIEQTGPKRRQKKSKPTPKKKAV